LIICNFDVAPNKESKEAPPVSLLSIQAEQTKKETVAKVAPVTMSSKIQGASQVISKQQQQPGKSGQQQQAALTPWGSGSGAAAAATVSPNWTNNNGSGGANSAGKQHASGESNSASNSHTNTNGNSGGFWTDISDKKSSKHANNKS